MPSSKLRSGEKRSLKVWCLTMSVVLDNLQGQARKKDDKDHTVGVFTRLMLRGQVRSALRFITDRVSGGGVLSLDSPSNVPGISVFDVLKQKHPEPALVMWSHRLLCCVTLCHHCLTWILMLVMLRRLPVNFTQ